MKNSGSGALSTCDGPSCGLVAALGALLGLRSSIGVSTPARGDEPEIHRKGCGLPVDYEPPWGRAPIPVSERVPEAVGFGSIAVIGCPPPPPAPGEPDVRIIDYELHGSPYREPNRRTLLQRLPSTRACYAAHPVADGPPVLGVALTIAGDGTVLDARVAAPSGARALGDCVLADVRTFRLHGAPREARSTVTYRYRVTR